MTATLSCQHFEGLLGPNASNVPVFGSQQAIDALQATLERGLTVTNITIPDHQDEALISLSLGIEHLREEGELLGDFSTLEYHGEDMPDISGQDARSPHPKATLLSAGSPPFNQLEIDTILARFRHLANYQESVEGYRPVLQLGVLTIDCLGDEPMSFAELFISDDELATHTVWICRYCARYSEADYVEHWRPFQLPYSEESDSYNGLWPQPAFSQSGCSPTDLSQPPSPAYSQQCPLDSEQNRMQEQTDSHVGTPQLKITYTPADKRRPHLRQRRRRNGYNFFDPTGLTDEQIFAGNPDNIQGHTLLRLAERYSNKQIFCEINARHGSMGVRSANVITKRLTHAIEIEAETTGQRPGEVRRMLAQAKARNGVRSKPKLLIKDQV